jgi:hypothetical protein
MEGWADMNKTQTFQEWNGQPISDDAWALHARHGTVAIESTADGAVAMLIDEGGVHRHFHVAPDKVPSFLGAAAAAWARRNPGGSVAVIWSDTKGKGVVAPPPPPPGPGPIGDDVIIAHALMGHHQLLAVGQLAAASARLRSRR